MAHLVETAIAGAVGVFFAPASAAAAGGAFNVIGAYAVGQAIMSLIVIPSFIVGLTTFGMTQAFTSGSYILSALAALVLAAEVGLTILLAAHIGASILGVAAGPVFVCALIGEVALGCGVLIVGAAAGGAAAVAATHHAK